MMSILMQSVLTIKLFYWIPNKLKFYDVNEVDLDFSAPFETLAVESPFE